MKKILLLFGGVITLVACGNDSIYEEIDFQNANNKTLITNRP